MLGAVLYHMIAADTLLWNRSLRRVAGCVVAMVAALGACVARASDTVPTFSATALTGQAVTSADLVGQPAVLILTPSRKAASDTRQWAKALRDTLAHGVFVRDILAVDLPFFMSEADAIGRARDKIPARYYDQTWLMSTQTLESALGVPAGSNRAFVFVLDAQGRTRARVSGAPTARRMEEIQTALRSVR